MSWYGKCALMGLALVGVLGVHVHGVSWGVELEVQFVSGKKHAYMGDPARKRGWELGYDRGYWAAKTDQEEGLAPDLGRHSVYHDPNLMYRYEFGNRRVFYHGFRTGFLLGYRQVWGKEEVAYVVPRKGFADSEGEVNGAMAGMEAEIMGPGGPVNPGSDQKKKMPAEKPASAQVLSDAL